MPINDDSTSDTWQPQATAPSQRLGRSTVPAMDSMVQRIAVEIANAGEGRASALATVRRKLSGTGDAVMTQIESALKSLPSPPAAPALAQEPSRPAAPPEPAGIATVAESVTPQPVLKTFYSDLARSLAVPAKAAAPSGPVAEPGAAQIGRARTAMRECTMPTHNALASQPVSKPVIAPTIGEVSAAAPLLGPNSPAHAGAGNERVRVLMAGEAAHSDPDLALGTASSESVAKLQPKKPQLQPMSGAAPTVAASEPVEPLAADHPDHAPASVASAEQASPMPCQATNMSGPLADMEARLTAAIATLSARPSAAPSLPVPVVNLDNKLAGLREDIHGLRNEVAVFASLHEAVGEISLRLDGLDRHLTAEGHKGPAQGIPDLAHGLQQIDARLAQIEAQLAQTMPAAQGAHYATATIQDSIAALVTQIEELRGTQLRSQQTRAREDRPVASASAAPAEPPLAPSKQATPVAAPEPSAFEIIRAEPAHAPAPGLDAEADDPLPSADAKDGRVGLSRDDLVASARRAARAAAARRAADPAPVAGAAVAAGAEPVQAAPNTPPSRPLRRGPQPQLRPAAPRPSPFSLSSPRALLVASALVLMCLCAGLIYGKLTQKRSGFSIERIDSPPPVASADTLVGNNQTVAMPPDATNDPVAATVSTPGSAPDSATSRIAVEQIEPAATSAATGDVTASVTPPVVEDIALTQASAAPVAAPAQTAPALKLPPAETGPLSLRMAAADGDAAAQFAVGLALIDAKAKSRDPKQAADWFERSAKQGFALAQYRLAALYERGQGRPVDLEKARDWYGQAAALGNIKAMHNLAVVLTRADAIAPDYRQGAVWFGKAAEHGLADSQFNLAVLYENGLGLEQSNIEAYRWYSLAAKQGDAEAAKRSDGLRSLLAPKVLTRLDAEIAAWRAKPADPVANTGVKSQAKSQAPTGTAPEPAAQPKLSAEPVLASTSAAKPEKAKAGSAPTRDQIMLTQQMLAKLGFEVGTDGVLDERTRKAIRSFETIAGLPPSGQLSAELMRRLSDQSR